MQTSRSGAALLATSLGFGVVQLDVSVVNVAVKAIGADLGGSVSGLQWIVAAYTLTFASLILGAGALGDRLGAKRVYVTGFAVFTAASVGCAVAPTLGVLIAARAVQGIGAAVLVPCSLTLLNHAYSDPVARARAVGLWAAGASVGVGAGPLVGGLLTDAFGWRAIFLINLPIGALGLALTVRYAAETTRSRNRSFDPPGQLTAVITLLALSVALVEGGRHGFTNPFVLVSFAIAVVAALGFVAVEARTTRPMLPLRMLASSGFSAATAIGVTINTAFYGLFFVLSLYFQDERHYSVLAAGLAFLPTSIAVFVGNVISGRRSDHRRVIAVGAVLVLLAGLGLLVAGHGTGYLALVGQLTVLGLGLGLIVPAMTSAMLGSVEATRSGIASGTLNTARQTGSVIGVALFGSFAADGLVGGLRLALLVSAVLALGVTLLARLLPAPSADDLGRGDHQRRQHETAGDDDAALETRCEVVRAGDRGEERGAGSGDPDR